MRQLKSTSFILASFLATTAFIGALAPMPLFAKSDAIRVAYATNTPAPDNSVGNKGDQSAQAPTADHAGNHVSDRKVMQKIRLSVMSDKSLSTYAHNVKIVSRHGKVTLKGPVKSDQEKQSIEAKATDVVGSGNVENDLTVKTTK